MNTFEFILDKYKLQAGRQYVIEIPNMGRNNLAELFAELGFTKGAEVGVFKGVYSEHLCKVNPKLHLYSIDPWQNSAYEAGIPDGSAPQSYFDDLYEEAKNRLAPFNCTLVRKTSMDALKDFEDNSLDFVYIDANHDFVNFAFDLHHWMKKVRPGGIIAGHDYSYFPFNKFNHVKKVLESYAWCYRMIPYFVVGTYAQEEGVIRDKYRSWFWVKTKTPLKEDSMLGKWDDWYKDVKEIGSFAYGDTVTYQMAADFMADIDEVEDWGCGTGGFKRLYQGNYTGLDGSANPFVDKVVDLRKYRSSVDGIVMRHVLEHNYQWEKILAGAVSSFNKKFCLVLFTPFKDKTQEIAHNNKIGVDVPDIAFKKEDIERFFEGLKWRLEENIKTKTGYGVEHVYFVEK